MSWAGSSRHGVLPQLCQTQVPVVQVSVFLPLNGRITEDAGAHLVSIPVTSCGTAGWEEPLGSHLPSLGEPGRKCCWEGGCRGDVGGEGRLGAEQAGTELRASWPSGCWRLERILGGLGVT